MSDDSFPEIPKERSYPKDWGRDIEQSLEAFKKNGMPGLAKSAPRGYFSYERDVSIGLFLW